jgi:hypothetical protein
MPLRRAGTYCDHAQSWARLSGAPRRKGGVLRSIRGTRFYFTTPISRKYLSTPG